MFTNKLLSRLKNASSITILTGAGISAESGVPTFRGKDGIWNDKKVEEIANAATFQKNPLYFWEYYNSRRDLLKNTKPNLGHYALVDMERYFEDFHLITQNTDSLHAIAGSKDVVELHGNIYRDRCSKCGDVIEIDGGNPVAVPTCNKCDATMRPDVLLFGEELDKKIILKAQQAAAECEVFFSIGTSSIVEPAAALPFLAKANGAYIVEVNIAETPISAQANESLRGPAGKILPALAIICEKLFS